MTDAAQMQQPTENIPTMFQDSGIVQNMTNEPPVESYQSLEPSRASLEEYNRSMLQYTQRQMSYFVDKDGARRDSGQSARSSASSGSNINAARLASTNSAGYQGCALCQVVLLPHDRDLAS
ncbi:unnamed protein product [Penicillium glandicola]